MKMILLFLFLPFQFLVLGQETIEFQNLFDATSSDSISCYRIPALVTAPNGDVLAAIDERIPSCNDLRDNTNINIVLRRSVDNGKTWSKIERVVDFPWGISASDPSFIVDLQTNEVFLFYNFMDLTKEKDVYYFHFIKSKDNGITWSEPQDITSQISKKPWHDNFKFITSGRGIQRRSGQLVHTLVNLEKGLYLFASDDHGNSFFLVEEPLIPGDESKVIERVDGSLLVNSRVNGAGIRYAHFSTDLRAEWKMKALPELPDPGCNASIISYTSTDKGYKKNRMLFSNANSNKERKNMTVRISYDEGETWSSGKTVYKGASAYSSLTVLKNGNIGLFFEKDGYQKNVFAQFSLQWLTNDLDEVKNPE